jgi:Papain family cysteine protease
MLQLCHVLFLASIGPMVACMDVYEDFRNWGGGRVYHYDGTSAYAGGHCLLVIGYDDDNACWIVKNSWSPSWGDGGFASIGYGECGIDGDSPFLGFNFGSPFWGLSNVQLPDDYRFEVCADRFRGTSLDDVAVYDAAMDLFYLGSNVGATFQWGTGMSLSGEPSLRRPKIFAGSFTGSWESTLLVYDSVIKTWNAGHFAATGPVALTSVGNTSGFGDLADGRPFWNGYFSALDREQMLFYFPGDANWWLGTLSNQLTWKNADDTTRFGNIADGRPLLMADFDGTAHHVFLFYSPGDNNWWLGSLASGTWVWSRCANTSGFGTLAGARFFTGYFRGVFQADSSRRTFWCTRLQIRPGILARCRRTASFNGTSSATRRRSATWRTGAPYTKADSR